MHLLLIEILYSDDIVGPGIKVTETWIVLQNVETVCIFLMLTYKSSITWSPSWEICMQVRKQHLELDMEQHTGSK